MKTLRINLHIRGDVSPKLFEALASMPPRPRAERLRKLAELGLQIESGQLHSMTVSPCRTPAPVMQASASALEDSEAVADRFGDDLASLLDMTAMAPEKNGTR